MMNKTYNSLITLFNLGMIRELNEPIESKSGLVLNLGPGEKHIEGSIGLEYPEYNAECDRIPFDDCSVDMIHCYHF